MKLPPILGVAGILATFTFSPSFQLKAQDVSTSTVPSGFITLELSAGTGTSHGLSAVSLPLRSAPDDAVGQLTGKITGVGASTLSNASAGWEAGAFSDPAAPYFVRIKSGNAEGRIFQISTSTANTETQLTVVTDGADLTTLGISSDSYEIFPADTIASIFGSPGTTGILGGASSSEADNLQVYVPSVGWRTYYYNTSSNQWLRVGPPVASDNVVLRPDQGIIYLRLAATPLEIVLLGTVPDTDSQTVVKNSGITFLGSNWPVDTTLATSGIADIPGWVKSASSSTADTVQLYLEGIGWRSYFHNGTNWVRVGPPIVSDDVVIPAGGAVMLVKIGTASGTTVLDQSIPYSL